MLLGACQLESPPCHRLSTESIFRFFDLEIRFVQECPHNAIMAVDLLYTSLIVPATAGNKSRDKYTLLLLK